LSPLGFCFFLNKPKTTENFEKKSFFLVFFIKFCK
ncbi:unnamed protein product, partial [Staurois parvus]